MGDGDPTACPGQAWQAAVASKRAFWRSAAGAQRIRGYLPEQGQLFVGNSLVVRLIDAPGAATGRVSRSTATAAPAAIDGLIATAAGVQRASARPTLAIVGDLSRALRSQLAGPCCAPGVGAAGADRGE